MRQAGENCNRSFMYLLLDLDYCVELNNIFYQNVFQVMAEFYYKYDYKYFFIIMNSWTSLTMNKYYVNYVSKHTSFKVATYYL